MLLVLRRGKESLIRWVHATRLQKYMDGNKKMNGKGNGTNEQMHECQTNEGGSK